MEHIDIEGLSPVLDWNADNLPGATLVDAEGTSIPLCSWINIETGEAEILLPDKNGNPYYDKKKDDIARERRTFKLPINITFLGADHG